MDGLAIEESRKERILRGRETVRKRKEKNDTRREKITCKVALVFLQVEQVRYVSERERARERECVQERESRKVEEQRGTRYFVRCESSINDRSTINENILYDGKRKGKSDKR